MTTVWQWVKLPGANLKERSSRTSQIPRDLEVQALCLFETWRQELQSSFPGQHIPKTLFSVNLKGQKWSQQLHICRWGPSAFLPPSGMLSMHWRNTEGQGHSRDFHLPNPGPRERLCKYTKSNPVPCRTENVTSLAGDTQAQGSVRPTDSQSRRKEYLAPE